MGESTQVNNLVMHIAPRNSGQLEQVVDELSHTLASRTDPMKMVLPVGVQLVSIVFQQGLTKAIHTP